MSDSATELKLPFWDEAEIGQTCMVPCFAEDEDGDAADCEAVVVGTMQPGRVFAPLDPPGPNIKPAITYYQCIEHSGEGRPIFMQLIPDGSR